MSASQHENALERAAHPEHHPAFDQFVATISALRAPDGCPWDREQTHSSIAHNMIEEAYEAVDAIEAGDVTHMREELGDVLLQVVLQSQMRSSSTSRMSRRTWMPRWSGAIRTCSGMRRQPAHPRC